MSQKLFKHFSRELLTTTKSFIYSEIISSYKLSIAVWLKDNGVVIGSLVSVLLLIFVFHPDLRYLGFVPGFRISESVGSGPVLNLTFDDSENPWKDYSALNHQFNSLGAVSWADRDVCKWYGCADFSATSGDYLNSSTKFS